MQENDFLMRTYLRLLIRLRLIYSFNLKMNGSINEFYEGLNKIVDFNKKFQLFPNKSFIGEKYKSSFCIRKRGKASNREVIGRFKTLEKSTVLKVRITLSLFQLFFLLFLFVIMSIIIISASISFNQYLILVFLGFTLIIVLIPFFILLEQLSSIGMEVKSKFKKLI